jgi:hypothetical protein
MKCVLLDAFELMGKIAWFTQTAMQEPASLTPHRLLLHHCQQTVPVLLAAEQSALQQSYS